MAAQWLHRIEGIQDEDERGRILHAAQYATGTAFLAGYETVSYSQVLISSTVLIYFQTSSTLQTFFFAMARYPDTLAKAQEELENVVGANRLPDFSDKENLPYVNALIKEVMRFFPILPLGVPHRVIVEDEYQGMRIPEGSIIFPNVW
jgi:hypothetical protein